MKTIVGITGASGIVMGKRLLEELPGKKLVVVSEGAKKVMKYEGIKVKEIRALSNKYYSEKQIDCLLASSSASPRQMIIIPCSMKTLSAIANGFSHNLITRSAENVLKLNGKLVLAPRETPLSLPNLKNMKKAKLAGIEIVPPNMAYYYNPKTVEQVTDFFVGKILDVLDIEHELYQKWES